MIQVCPKPPIWASIDKKLTEFSVTHVCSPLTPPKSLIFAGWAHSTNKQKQDRWQETIDWANHQYRLQCRHMAPFALEHALVITQ